MDSLRSHPRFRAAARGAIEIYLQLHDDAEAIRPAMTPAELEEEQRLVEQDERKKTEAKDKQAREREERLKEKAEAKAKAAAAAAAAAKTKDSKSGAKSGKSVAPVPAPAAVEAEADQLDEDELVFDPDPRGLELIKTDEPLVEALKFLRPLQKEAGAELDTWLLTYEVAIRRSEFKLAKSIT